MTAVGSGVLDKAAIREHLDQGNTEESLLTEGSTQLNLDFPANEIGNGDVLVINSRSEDTWHVVMAINSNHEDYRQIQVMSHYRGVANDRQNSIFTKITFGDVLEFAPGGVKSITYKSLI